VNGAGSPSLATLHDGRVRPPPTSIGTVAGMVGVGRRQGRRARPSDLTWGPLVRHLRLPARSFVATRGPAHRHRRATTAHDAQRSSTRRDGTSATPCKASSRVRTATPASCDHPARPPALVSTSLLRLSRRSTTRTVLIHKPQTVSPSIRRPPYHDRSQLRTLRRTARCLRETSITSRSPRSTASFTRQRITWTSQQNRCLMRSTLDPSRRKSQSLSPLSRAPSWKPSCAYALP